MTAAALWAGSLALPSLGARGGTMLGGYEVLLQGFGAWRYGVAAWFANPVLLAGILSYLGGWPRVAVALLWSGLALALSSYWSGELAAVFGRSVPQPVFGPGFYCWLAAHITAVIGASIGMTAGSGS